jgi:hypothetical protein
VKGADDARLRRFPFGSLVVRLLPPEQGEIVTVFVGNFRYNFRQLGIGFYPQRLRPGNILRTFLFFFRNELWE